MKKAIFVLVLIFAGVGLVSPQTLWAYNYGDYRSVTLTTKAWEALAADDLDAVLAYTNKCIELYSEQARKMQNSMVGYAEGSNDEIFSYWALNDVATSLFIQGEAYRKAGELDKAREAYQRIVDSFTYGQTWDPKGWFWKPAEAAQEKISMIESGSDLDFGDYTSEHLVVKAWEALEADDLKAVTAYTNKCIELYGQKAKEMQNSLTAAPLEKQEIFSYWALNDVGTALFIQGEAYRRAGDTEKSKMAFKKLIDEYFYAQCWDPQGWFWRPADAAEQNLETMGS